MQLGNMGGSFGGGLVVEPGKGNATMDALWWELQAGLELSRDRVVAAGWVGAEDVADSFVAKALDWVSALGHMVVGGEASETTSHEPFYEGLLGHACSGTRLVQRGYVLLLDLGHGAFQGCRFPPPAFPPRFLLIWRKGSILHLINTGWLS
jgi:hypothetical protein